MSEGGLTKAKLLSYLLQSRRRLLASIEGLEEGEMTGQPVVGHWTVGDLITHLVAWEEVAIQRLDLVCAGRASEIERVPDDEVDAWNARAYELGRSRSLAEVLQGLEDTRGRLLKLVGSMTEEQLNEVDVVTRRYLHEDEHTAQIAEWRQETSRG